MADPRPAPCILADSVYAAVQDLLGPVDEQLQRDYPGARPHRQPVHTVYVPADRYRPGLARAWGDQALAAVEDTGGVESFLDAAGISADLRATVGQKVADKLSTEPIED